MKRIRLFIPILALLAAGCATAPPEPPKTQLQIREFQTRAYQTQDTKMVLKAMLNVLQDEGFIVKNASVELGLLTAEKQMDVSSKSDVFWSTLAYGKEATWKKAYIMECTANVSDFGKDTKVRVNFQGKSLDNKGNILEIKHVDDEKYYQEFFSKVDKGIFIQKEKL